MANKKISQLAGTVPNEIVSGSYLFASAAGNVGVGYETKKITAQQIAEYVFTGAEGGLGFPATQLSGTKDVYLNNSNWVNSTATQPPNYGFLMLRTSDGLLTTGSGIGTPVDGDNLGDHTATQALNMANNDINNVDDIRFYQSAHSIIAKGVGNNDNLHVKAGNELALEGTTHVRISGLGLDLASIPISGDVTITGGNLEIDPGNKLIVNEIQATGAGGLDKATLRIDGALSSVPNSVLDNNSNLNWSVSNIQYERINQNTTINFSNVTDGQTLTMYVENYHTTNPFTATFSSGDAVVWGAEFDNSSPVIAQNKTNVYTFVRIHTGIFASAVTGYVH
jgi:hypothetical protein